MTQQLMAAWYEPCWIHQPFETEAEHQAFTLFKDLPARMRSMATVTRHLKISLPEVRALSERYFWRERIAAYDTFTAQGKIQLFQERKDDTHAKHLSVLDLALEVITRELNSLIERQRMCDATGGGISHLKPNELRAFIRDMIKLERLVRGDVTERAEEQYDLSSFSTDELVMWRTLTTKARSTRVKNIDQALDDLDDD